MQSGTTGSGLGRSSEPYSGSTEYGSGTTGGADYGNKHSKDSSSKDGKYREVWSCCPDVLTQFLDSTSGKLMEKVGGMFHSDKMEQKGAEKRAQAGAGSGYDDSTSGSYGTRGNDDSNY